MRHFVITIHGFSAWELCSCGWRGPARSWGDEHLGRLLASDRAWHLEVAG